VPCQSLPVLHCIPQTTMGWSKPLLQNSNRIYIYILEEIDNESRNQFAFEDRYPGTECMHSRNIQTRFTDDALPFRLRINQLSDKSQSTRRRQLTIVRSLALNTPIICTPSASDIFALAPKLAGMKLGGVIGLYSLTPQRSFRVVALSTMAEGTKDGVDMTSTISTFDYENYSKP
jgi:hypothetical protein